MNIQSLFQAIPNFLQARRATEQLAWAIKKGDMEGMAQALDRGANPNKATVRYEVYSHFPEYEHIQGALNIAAREQLPQKAFELLISKGARPVDAITGTHPEGWKFEDTIPALIARAELDNNTSRPAANLRKATRL